MTRLFEQVVLNTRMVTNHAIDIAVMVQEMVKDVRVASNITSRIVVQAQTLAARGVAHMRVTWMDTETPVGVVIEPLSHPPNQGSAV